MLYITKDGHVDAGAKIKMKIFPQIERGPLRKVNGLIVHQTGGSFQSALSSYSAKGAKGAHFLIDKDGTIYQTASLYKVTIHTGMLRSRCLHTQKCTPAEFKVVSGLEKKWQPQAMSDREYRKPFPDRYPINADAIGIEIVGRSFEVPGQKEQQFEDVNDAQNASLKWLVRELADTLNISMSEIYRHPEIARKTPSEAGAAKW